MKKYWKKGLCLGLSLLLLVGQPLRFSPSDVSFSGLTLSYGAERPASVTATTLNVRSAPGTASAVVGKLSQGALVTVLGEANAADGSLWYQIRFTGTGGGAATGYVMGTYVKFSSALPDASSGQNASNASNYSSNADFEAYLNSQGFPESYRPGLRELHARYPQWIFTAFDTGLDWNEVIQNESLVGRNLVASSSPSSWKSTAPGAYDWTTSTWPGFDGSSWVAASEDIIRYYMDPRNFLNETYIFQFLLQNYDASVHTREGLASMVKGTFLEGNGSVGGAYQGISSGAAGSTAGTSGQTGTGTNTGTGVNTGTGTNSGGNTGPGSSSSGNTGSGNASGEAGYGPGYSQGAVSGNQGTLGGTTGTGGSTGTNGTGDFSNVWKGVAPGANISWREEMPSISRHSVDLVAEVALVGPGQSIGASESGNTASGVNSGPGTGTAASGNGLAGVNVAPSGSGLSGINVTPGTNGLSGVTVSGSDGGSGVVGPGGLGDQSGQNTQTSSGNTVFSGTSAPYVDILLEAGIQSGVSPYVLTAMILQEQGRDGKSDSISGASGFYNYYNFEAYASNGMTAVQRGLWYASQSGSYLRPWNSADKAIIGGALQYGQNYMKAGQNTFYLKKFNVQGSNPYMHQYMTNVEGAAAEGAKMGEAYSESMRQTAMRFSIPVYRNMPDNACIKPGGNGSPNNKLLSLTVNGYALVPAFSQDTLVYDVNVGSGDTSVTVYAVAADSTAVIAGTGTIALNSAVTEVKVSVTAQNGTVREYRLRITRGNGTSAGGAAGTAPGTTGSGMTGPGTTGSGAAGTGTTGSGAAAGSSNTGPGGSNVTIVP